MANLCHQRKVVKFVAIRLAAAKKYHAVFAVLVHVAARKLLVPYAKASPVCVKSLPALFVVPRPVVVNLQNARYATAHLVFAKKPRKSPLNLVTEKHDKLSIYLR